MLSNIKIAMCRVVLLLMMVASNSAVAAWVKVNEDERSVTYANLEVIREAGDEVKLWWMSDFKTAQTNNDDVYLSSRRQYEFDCQKGEYRPLFFSRYSENMATGRVVYSNSATGEWKRVPSKTVGEILLKFACGEASSLSK